MKNVNESSGGFLPPLPPSSQPAQQNTEYKAWYCGPKSSEQGRLARDLPDGHSAAYPRPGTLDTEHLYPRAFRKADGESQELQAPAVRVAPTHSSSPRNAPPVTVTPAQSTGREGWGSDCPGFFILFLQACYIPPVEKRSLQGTAPA